MQVCEKTRTHHGPKKELVSLGLSTHAFTYGLWEHQLGPSLLPSLLFTWPLQLQCLNASQVAERRNNVISVSPAAQWQKQPVWIADSFLLGCVSVYVHTLGISPGWLGEGTGCHWQGSLWWLFSLLRSRSHLWEFQVWLIQSVAEDWMMLVVTSSVGYTCGEQCGVVGVSY